MSTPRWSLPADFAAVLAAEGIVELVGWEPLVVSALGDTSWQGREIPVAWQIEILGGTRGLDGYALEDLVIAALEAVDPGLRERCQSDTEMATCVLWAEAEADGRELARIAWEVATSAR